MRQIAHIQNNKNEPTSFFSFFMEKLEKVDIIYVNRHLGTFLMKLSIPKTVTSPFIYSRNMSYHKNINKGVHTMLFKVGFETSDKSIRSEIETHRDISAGTIRFFDTLCPTLIDDDILDLKKASPHQRARNIIQILTNKLNKTNPKNEEFLSRTRVMIQRKDAYMYYTFMEYIKGETLVRSMRNATFQLVGKERYILNLQRYLAMELAMIGYEQKDNQESNYMIYEHSGQIIKTRKMRNGSMKGGINTPPSLLPMRSVDSAEAKEEYQLEQNRQGMLQEEVIQRQRMADFVRYGKKSRRKKEINIVVVDLSGVGKVRNKVSIDWSLEAIRENYRLIDTLFKGGVPFTEDDAEMIQHIKKLVTVRHNALEQKGDIYPLEAVPQTEHIIRIYNQYYQSFQAGLALFSDEADTIIRHSRTLSSPHRRSRSSSPRSLISHSYEIERKPRGSPSSRKNSRKL